MWFIYLCAGLGILIFFLYAGIAIEKEAEAKRLMAEAKQYQAMTIWREEFRNTPDEDIEALETRLQ